MAMVFQWERKGRIITPNKDVAWASTWVGASFARQIGDSPMFEIFVTGRDDKNRSRVGVVLFDIQTLKTEWGGG